MNPIERFAAKAMTGELLTDVWRSLKRARCAAVRHRAVRYRMEPDAYFCRCGKRWVPAEERRGW